MRTTIVLLLLALTASVVIATQFPKTITSHDTSRSQKGPELPLVDHNYYYGRRCLPRGASCRYRRRGKRCCRNTRCRKILRPTRRGVFRCLPAKRKPRPPSPSPTASPSPRVFDDSPSDEACRSFWQSTESPPSTLAELQEATRECPPTNIPADILSAPLCTQTCDDTGLKRTLFAPFSVQTTPIPAAGSELESCLVSLMRSLWATWSFPDCSEVPAPSGGLVFFVSTPEVMGALTDCGFVDVSDGFFIVSDDINLDNPGLC